MDVIKTAKSILEKIEELEDLKKSIIPLARDRVTKEVCYEKTIGKTLISLKNGGEHKIDGEVVINPPVSIMDKLAKAICWEEKLSMDTAIEKSKANDKIIEIVKAQLNAYQSVNKHLDQT